MINQGKLQGIQDLENKLTEKAFTGDRVFIYITDNGIGMSTEVTDGVAVRVLEILSVKIENLRQQVLEEITPKIVEPVVMPGTSRGSTSSNQEYLPQTTTDFTSGAVSTRFCALLSNWVEPHKLGYVVANGAGFQLSNGDVLAPQISFFSRERLKPVPRTYPQLVPNLVVEIKSAFDRLTLIQEKVMGFLEIGVEVALLINPDYRTVAVYNRHQKQMITTLTDDDKLNFPELLPGWSVSVSQLWPAVLD